MPKIEKLRPVVHGKLCKVAGPGSAAQAGQPKGGP